MFWGDIVMFSKVTSSHFVSPVLIMTVMAATVWTLDKHSIIIEVTRLNGTLIKWDEAILDKKTIQFKQMSIAVRNQLRNDLEKELNVTDIKVNTFLKIHGKPGTFCEFEFKMKSDLGKEGVENVLNRTLDIGAEKELNSYDQINMSLLLPGVKWIDPYGDDNSSEYKNLTTGTRAVLAEFFQDIDDVVAFEIVSLAKAPDGWLVVEFYLFVDSDSNVNKNDVEDTFAEFTKSDTFGKMLPYSKRQGVRVTDPENNKGNTEDEKNTAEVGLILFAAMIMCLVIVTFLVVVVRRNCKYIKEHSPEATFESYRKKVNKMKKAFSLEAQEETKTTPAGSVNSIILDAHDNPVSES